MDNDTEKKKAKGIKKCVTERHLKFNDFKDSIFNDIKILRTQQGFKSDLHTIYTVNYNKTAMSSNDDKRLQTYNKIITYPYGTTVCESEMLSLLFKKIKHII